MPYYRLNAYYRMHRDRIIFCPEGENPLDYHNEVVEDLTDYQNEVDDGDLIVEESEFELLPDYKEQP